MPDRCPPDGAVGAVGVFFRLVRKNLKEGDTPSADDWLPPYRKRKGECVGGGDRCECHAHSLIGDLQSIEAARESVPWVRGKAVARVELLPSMGKTLETPSAIANHHDWWPSPGDLVPESVVVVEHRP
jgi:hypothetical protein